MSNGAGKFNPFSKKCICISTLGATVTIWEKFVEITEGQVAPCPFLGAPMALSYDVIGNEHTRADTIGTVPVPWAGHFLC